MRIVGGQFRGRPLRAQPGQDTRPTSDRARQAIFNILEHAPWSPGVEDLRVIDLFAGSGAMGLEALSRGAAECLFVETSGPALEALRANIEALGVGDRCRILRADATNLPSPRLRGEGGARDAEQRGRVRGDGASGDTPSPSQPLRGRAPPSPPLHGGEGFDLALLDPPYGKGLGEKAMAGLREGGWLAEDALIVLERGMEEAEVTPEGFQLLDERRYGAASVAWYSNSTR